MITLFVDVFNPVSQDFYDVTINSLQFHRLTCTCGHAGCLNIHGYYHRSIKSGDGFVRLRICRVSCSHCGKTHALLLASIVPYSQIPLTDQVMILSDLEDGQPPTLVMEHTPSIDENNCRSIIRQYLYHWKQRLLSASISLKLPLLTLQCFSCFGRQFMQNKKTGNILFLPTT